MTISLDAASRNDLGRGASRRLRKTERIPAVIIGQGKDAVSVSVDEKKLIHAAEQNDFYTQNVVLNLDGSPITVKVKDIQRYPVTDRIIHLDFLRTA